MDFLRVELAKVDHKLECVMADLEVVGVSTLKFSGILCDLTFMVHSDLEFSTFALAHHGDAENTEVSI
jgi:hypothetical protein